MILSTDHSVPSILRSANPFGTWAQENPGPGTLSTAGTIEELLKWDTPEEASSRSRDTANPASGEASQAASHSAKQQEEQKLGAQTADKSSAKEKGGGAAPAPRLPQKKERTRSHRPERRPPQQRSRLGCRSRRRRC